MREIEAYKTVDGKVFECEYAAKNHEVDLIGEELDGLIFQVLNLDVSRIQTRKGILYAIQERKKLHDVIKKLSEYLEII